MRLRVQDLLVVPFHEGLEVRDFDCGNADLNEFLTTDEVVNYQKEWYGFTYLVHRATDWSLVGYYTIAQDGLEIPDDWIKERMNQTLNGASRFLIGVPKRVPAM